MKRLLAVFLISCRLSAPVSSSGQDAEPDSGLVDARRSVVTKADSGYVDDDGSSDACNVACVNLWRLQCSESGRNAAGQTCSSVCRKSLSLLNVSCVSLAKTQSDVRLCQVRCER